MIVVGAGGTGTYFLKEFSRFIHGTSNVGKFINMVIFDGDTVESKNLARQCFCEEDVGRNKAAVMAEVLNEAFGLHFIAHASYLSSLKQLKQVVSSDSTPVIISCVDNHACRLLLEEYFDSVKNCIYFDSANEFDTGECVYSYKKDGKVEGPLRSYYFPHIKEEIHKAREEMSCEELNSVAPQHIFTNMFAGNLLCTAMASLLDKKHTPGFAYFNALEHECSFVSYRESEEG